MPNVTIAIPEELKKRMDACETVNWSGVARQAIERQLDDLEFIKEFKKDSSMTEEDAVRLGRLVNKGLSERYRKLAEQRKTSKKKN